MNDSNIHFVDLVFFILFQLALGAVIGKLDYLENPMIWIVWYLCSAGFIFFIAHRRNVLKIWFKREGIVRDILWAVKMYPILFLSITVVSFLFPPIDETEKIQFDLNSITLLVLVVIGPFSEELIFRGFLYEYLRRRVKKETAIIFTSLIFALFHPVSSFPVIMTLAVMLNFLYEMRDNIIVPMLLHSLNNLVVLILYGISRR